MDDGKYVSPPPEKTTLGRVRPWMVLAVVAFMCLVMIPITVLVNRALNDAQTSVNDTSNQNNNIKATVAPLAAGVQSICAQDNQAATELAKASACAQASAVQSVVAIPGPSGQPGQPGTPGTNGRGIVSTNIVNGDLVLTFNQKPFTQDVGHVVGQDGGKGDTGKGITTAGIQGNDLIINYSDNTSSDVGPVVGQNGKDGTDGAAGTNGTNGQNGAQGCGFTTPHITGNTLYVNYDSNCGSNSGTEVAVGPLPQEAACPDGSVPSTTDVVEPSGLTTTTLHGVLTCN